MTKSQNMKAVRSGMRSGFTMVELMLVLLVGGVLILAGVQGYKKIYIPMLAEADIKMVGFYLAGIEKYKNTMNGGAYLASPGIPVADTEIAIILGGADAVADLAGWSYGCQAGSSSVISIRSPGYRDSNRQSIVIAGINSKYAPWIAYSQGTFITLKLYSVICAP